MYMYGKYPFKQVTPICDANLCPYCFFVKRVKSVISIERYAENPQLIADLKAKKVKYEDAESLLVKMLVDRGYPKDCDVCRFVNPWMERATIVVCPNCTIDSGWQVNDENAMTQFQFRAEKAIDKWFDDKVREIIAARL